MKARIKKMASSRRRKTSKPAETLQDLKNATDKYYSIRETGFFMQEVAHFVIRMKNLLTKRDRETFPKVDTYVESAFVQWGYDSTRTEEDYVTDLEVGYDLIESAIVGLARLQFEERIADQKREPSEFEKHMKTVHAAISRIAGIHL